MVYAFLRRNATNFRKAYPRRAEKYECLRCERDPSPGDCLMYDTDHKLFACSNCMTLYEWFSPEYCEMKFLRPLTKEKILKEPIMPLGC
jgi:transcription elongation factor Elf1